MGQIHAAVPAPEAADPEVADLTVHIELPEYGPHRPRHWKATWQTPLDHCDATLPINTATMFYNVSCCWWLTWPHTNIHAYIYTYICWHPCIYHVLQTPTNAGRPSLTKIRQSFKPRAFTCLKSLHFLMQPILTSGYNQPGWATWWMQGWTE